VFKPQQAIFPSVSKAQEWLSAAHACKSVPCFSLGNMETRPNLAGQQNYSHMKTSNMAPSLSEFKIHLKTKKSNVAPR
jgi:hypothetical protein